MGNQARQSQELELWPMMDASGNTQSRQVNSKRSDMPKRGKVSDYDRMKREEPRQTRNVRSGNLGTPDVGRSGGPNNVRPIRVMNPNMPKTSDRRRVVKTAGTNAPGKSTGNIRTARAARSTYVEPNRHRTSPPKANTNARAAKKKKAGRRARTAQIFAFVWIVAMSAVIFFMGKIFIQNMQKTPVMQENKTNHSPVEDIPVADSGSDIRKPKIQEDFLTISEYNRPGTELASVKNIFVHYTANPGTSAAQNRSYFESLGQTHERAASAHFIIGYDGEIVQCIPLEEEAYAVVERNGDSISIECCYLEKDGSFTQETYDSLIEMLAWLTEKYDLEAQDILRHYDCGGKKCPLYYVEHEDAWQKLLEDVRQYKNKSI